MADDEKKGILLESGTNEMEIVEFSVGASEFGINVIKVREIINCVPTTHLPQTHPCVEGLIKLRGEIMSVIDLALFLGYPPSEEPDKDFFIITEFNRMKVGFRVHSVSRIHRISWDQIESPDRVASAAASGCTVGIVKMEERIILLLDFEKIVTDINPRLGFQVDTIRNLPKRDRSQVKVVAVEDSETLRSYIKDLLVQAGYEQLRFFANGADAWNYLENTADVKGDDFINDVNIVITDIEMPQMDGHHLTKRIKDHRVLGKLPVVIFSSLITDDLLHKGESVGANAQISKPQFNELALIMDDIVFGQQ